MGGLILLAFRATSDEVDNSFVHFWPPEVSADELDRFVLSHVSRHFSSAKNLILTGATGASEAYGSTGSKI